MQNVPPAAVISLPRHARRRATVESRLRAAGIPFDWADAVDGNLLSAADLRARRLTHHQTLCAALPARVLPAHTSARTLLPPRTHTHTEHATDGPTLATRAQDARGWCALASSRGIRRRVLKAPGASQHGVIAEVAGYG